MIKTTQSHFHYKMQIESTINRTRFSSAQYCKMKLLSNIALLLISIFLFSCDDTNSCKFSTKEVLQEGSHTNDNQPSVADYKFAIERVLQEDSHTNDNQPSITDVVVRMKKIDLNGCPQEFKKAYLNHIVAWEKREYVEKELLALKKQIDSITSTINDKMNNNPDYQAIVLLRTLGGDYAGAARDDMAIRQAILKPYLERIFKLKTEMEEAQREIRDTFDDVKKIAITYDAKLP